MTKAAVNTTTVRIFNRQEKPGIRSSVKRTGNLHLAGLIGTLCTIGGVIAFVCGFSLLSLIVIGACLLALPLIPIMYFYGVHLTKKAMRESKQQ